MHLDKRVLMVPRTITHNNSNSSVTVMKSDYNTIYIKRRHPNVVNISPTGAEHPKKHKLQPTQETHDVTLQRQKKQAPPNTKPTPLT
jgi:hypothetical protein